MWTGASYTGSKLSFWLCRKVLTRSYHSTYSRPLTKRSWRYSNTDTHTYTQGSRQWRGCPEQAEKRSLCQGNICSFLCAKSCNAFSLLQLIVCGLGKIDIQDWRVNTRLKHCTADSSVVKWFWKAVELFDEERRARLLQFVTGSSRVPLQGFKALQGQNMTHTHTHTLF